MKILGYRDCRYLPSIRYIAMMFEMLMQKLDPTWQNYCCHYNDFPPTHKQRHLLLVRS